MRVAGIEDDGRAVGVADAWATTELVPVGAVADGLDAPDVRCEVLLVQPATITATAVAGTTIDAGRNRICSPFTHFVTICHTHADAHRVPAVARAR